jgi:cardiolipin synthase A/B
MSANRRKGRDGNYLPASSISLVRGGKPYFDCLLEMIHSARESIHLQTYIYDDDETGNLVADALLTAVNRGVAVYLLADGYASGKLRDSFVRRLSAGGVHFRFFDPLFRSRYFYLGRRMHHKIVVTDSCRALTGGVNISNRYNDMPGSPAWLDFAVYAEGEPAQQLCILCWKAWNNFHLNSSEIPCKDVVPYSATEPADDCLVSISRNDWVRRKNDISSTYVNMFRNAKSHITILCSYFLPGRVIRKHLAYAAKRGVKVTIITAGLSDVMVAKYAERYMYRWLLKNKIRLYEYQPNVLHGKIAVCDGEWLTIGSYNINNISAYASIELNLNIRSQQFAAHAEQVLQQIKDRDCIEITPEYHRSSNNIWKRIVRWFSYELIRTAVYLFTFYFKHQH